MTRIKWINRIVLFAILASACGRVITVPTARSTLTAPPDFILVNGKVFTADLEHPYAEAVAINAGRFTAVGTNAEVRGLASPATRFIDVGGRLVTPGLIEAHAHFDLPPPGRHIALPNLPFPGPTAEETLAGVAKAAREGPGWLSGMTGYPVFNDPRNWRDALDAVAPNNPVMLSGCCGHLMMLNSRALDALGLADGLADPVGGRWGRDASGRLNGQAYESAVNFVTRRAMAADPDASMEAGILRRGAETYARWGVTSVHQMAHEATLADVRAAIERADLRIKWTVYAWGLPKVAIADAWREVDTDGGVWPARARLGGSKWVLDGSPLDRGAFLQEDYSDRPGARGRSNYSEAQLHEILSGALNSARQVALHVVGDAEADTLLRIMNEMAPAERWRGLRVRIEHGDGIFGDRIARAAALGVVIVQQPIHFGELKVEGDQSMQDARWGDRAKRFLPLRSLLEGGIRLAFSSDSLNADDTANPFLNIMLAASYPRRPDQAITREQALTAYTAGGAYAEREETRKGKVIVGMAADLAVLSQDILTVPLAQLPKTTSLLTVVDGAIVYADGPFSTAGATRAPPPPVVRH